MTPAGNEKRRRLRFRKCIVSVPNEVLYLVTGGKNYMGYLDFLTVGAATSPPSLEESLYQLENASMLFVAAWLKSPPEMHRAHRSSQDGLTHLDHIANLILRARDEKRANTSYSGSALETQLAAERAKSVSPVTVAEQDALVALGPGSGVLPRAGQQISLERLLTKFKHRRPNTANFRISSNREHYLIIAVNTQRHLPESIIEFSVGDFCAHARAIIPLL